jgi:GNAT superfamily N-acetyltransferase
MVTEADLDAVLPLMRSYCDFYHAAPSDNALQLLCRALIGNPQADGFQLLARDETRRAIGFATVFWSWSTLMASRIGVMNDLFVSDDARRAGVGGCLIEACRQQAAEHGAAELVWQTAKDNFTAQSLYDRIGGRRSEWIDYLLPVS